MIGNTLLHDRIAGRLGAGGMGEVFVAEDQKLHRSVALGILPIAFASDPDRRQRLEQEARIVGALNHPNIVTLHSVESSDRRPPAHRRGDRPHPGAPRGPAVSDSEAHHVRVAARVVG